LRRVKVDTVDRINDRFKLLKDGLQCHMRSNITIELTRRRTTVLRTSYG
jgi:hypothetical protein